MPIQIKVPEEMAQALQKLADERRHARTLEIVLILERELGAAGLWPPRAEGR